MTTHTPDLSVELLCHVCGYDLRAHPPDGKCPECGASVAEARRVAAIPRRPAWRESDPRWRRRMLIGAWILVLVPLMDVLMALEWTSKIPVPAFFDYRGTVLTLKDTLLDGFSVYQPVVFCIGIVLLFSKERRRRHGRLDWMRRWGVICSYNVFLLSAVHFLIIAALVVAGIAMVYLGMPPEYQPGVTGFFARASAGYLRYGPYPGEMSGVVLAAFASIAVLFACVPLFDALRSSGPRRLAAIVVAPLALFALMHLGQAGWYCLGSRDSEFMGLGWPGIYFRPPVLLNYAGGWMFQNVAVSSVVVEVVKWCTVAAIAVWLTIAQLAARRRHR